jgi:hypothetical protein
VPEEGEEGRDLVSEGQEAGREGRRQSHADEALGHLNVTIPTGPVQTRATSLRER